MGRVLRRALTAAALLAPLGAAGCKGPKLFRSEVEMPPGVPTAPLSGNAVTGHGVIQASAVTPAGPTMSLPAPPKATPGKGPKVPATEIAVAWRNRVDYLPDPARNGDMGAGIAGQLFLFGPGMQFAPAEGKLTVALYDETPRPPGAERPPPEGWEFTKETLHKLRTTDERFGKSYALFLPWPSYRPDVTRVRIAVRYDPENGFPLYGEETKITLDTSAPGTGGPAWTGQPTVSPAGGFSPLGGPPPAAGAVTPAGGLPPANPNFGALPPAQPGVGPGGLPPIAIIPRTPGK